MHPTEQKFLAFSGVVLVTFFLQNSTASDQLPKLSAEQLTELKAGNSVQLPHRPDESPGTKVDVKFTTFVSLLIGVSAKEAWDVVNDKKGAPKFVGGILKSTILEKGEGWILVAQETKIGGPKKSYCYTLRHNLFPPQKVLFDYKEGEVRDVEGGWWFLEDKELKGTFLVYSLYIDPGRFAPQFIVRSGMKKSLPETLGYMKAEILRRKKTQ